MKKGGENTIKKLVKKVKNKFKRRTNMGTSVETISINGIEYVKKSGIKAVEYEGDIKIVILQRGWIMVGRFERNGSDCKLHNSYTIRKWGTTKGLGELAEKGKLNDTILDKNNGIVEFDYLTVVASLSCSEEVWGKIL